MHFYNFYKVLIATEKKLANCAYFTNFITHVDFYKRFNIMYF